MERHVVAVSNERRILVVTGLGHLRPDVVVTEDERSHFPKILIAAGVIRMHVSVDEKANRFVGNGSHCGDNLVSQRSILIIDQEHAVLTDEEPDVPAGAFDVGHLAHDRIHRHFHGVEVRLGGRETSHDPRCC